MKKKLLFALVFCFMPLAARIETIIISFHSIFEPDEKYIEKYVRKELGIGGSLNLLFSGIPSKEEVKQQLFTLLEKTDSIDIGIQKNAWETKNIPWERDYSFPPLLCQFVISSQPAHEEALIEKASKKLAEQQSIKKVKKQLLESSIECMFKTDFMEISMRPCKPMMALIEELHNKGYRLILTANIPGHGWDKLIKNNNEVKKLIKNFPPKTRYISGKTKQLTTSEKNYKNILQQHKIDPSTCLVIDCHKNNLHYPESMGMKTISFNVENYEFKKFDKQLRSLLA